MAELPAAFNFATDVVERWARDPSRLALMWAHPRRNVLRSASRR